jgi:hypothetical protein
MIRAARAAAGPPSEPLSQSPGRGRRRRASSARAGPGESESGTVAVTAPSRRDRDGPGPWAAGPTCTFLGPILMVNVKFSSFILMVNWRRASAAPSDRLTVRPSRSS